MAALQPRNIFFILLALLALWLLPAQIFPLYFDSNFPEMIAETLGSYGETDRVNPQFISKHAPANSRPADIYFDQTLSVHPAHHNDFLALSKQCARTKWRRDSEVDPIYLQCEGIYLGLTSVISQVKSCFKMAIEAGIGVILPKIPLRDANDLLNYNQGNHAADRDFGDWFDVPHLRAAMKQACPKLDIVVPEDFLTGAIVSRNVWTIDEYAARFFRERDGYFWAGKPFRAFFNEQLALLRMLYGIGISGQDMSSLNAADGGIKQVGEGATIISMRADIELFNLVNDATGHERHMWDDIGRTLRFRPEPRIIVDKMLQQIGEEHFFTIHFRGEADNMWASPQEQMIVDLQALDLVWEMYQDAPEMKKYVREQRKPPVYLACGSELSIDVFVQVGLAAGWNITSKYALAKSMDTLETLVMIESLPFDFQAIVDLGILVKGHFFIGIMGSAFSYTVANVRDNTGRYRGSSFDVEDDEGARTHMFPNDDRYGYGDITMERYPCCL